MIWALSRAVTSARRVMTVLLTWCLAWLLAPVVGFGIHPSVYLIGVTATAAVQTVLLVNTVHRIDAIRPYAQLPSRIRFGLVMAATSTLIELLEVVVPVILFRLSRGELTILDITTMGILVACGAGGVLVTVAVASVSDWRVALLMAMGLAAWIAASIWFSWLLAAPLLALLVSTLRLLPNAGFLLPRGGIAGLATPNYFLGAAFADRIVWINGAGVLAFAAIFTASAWVQGMRLPLAFGLAALNTPLATMVSGAPHLRRQLEMLGQPSSAWRHYAWAVLILQGSANAIIAAVYWVLGAHDLVRLVAIAAVLTAFEVGAVILLELRFPLRSTTTRREAWRHPRKYAIPAVTLMGVAWIPLL